jgi:hypothetical protein
MFLQGKLFPEHEKMEASFLTIAVARSTVFGDNSTLSVRRVFHGL